jgi:cation transport ATPase
VDQRGDLRASDADRERVVERLHKAATEGRIVSDELEQRVSQALKARTYRDLEETVADLPGQRRQTARAPQRRAFPGWALGAVRANPLLLILLIPALAVTAAMVLAAAVTWMVLTIVVLILGGRPGALRSPWGHAARRGLDPSRRGSHWA